MEGEREERRNLVDLWLDEHSSDKQLEGMWSRREKASCARV
jgi:hypothetical protein